MFGRASSVHVSISSQRLRPLFADDWNSHAYFTKIQDYPFRYIFSRFPFFMARKNYMSATLINSISKGLTRHITYDIDGRPTVYSLSTNCLLILTCYGFEKRGYYYSARPKVVDGKRLVANRTFT